MADSMNNISTILDKKMEYYGWDHENYIAEGEITVTITLSEYRNLIKEIATKKHDIEKAESDKYSRLTEIEKLKKENQILKDQFLKCRMGSDYDEPMESEEENE